ncbi:MAG: hypothetical protein PHT62_13855 [Desulfotomaculaceae bacterium]|nr:hypothetical protein [Desulfotomaculaceae bacterium]
MNKRLLKTLVMALVLIFMLNSIAFANQPTGNTVVLTSETVKQLRANATRDGIDAATQDKLITKLKNGESLDCMDPVKIEEAKKHLKVSKGAPRAEYTFADGSKYVIEVKVSDKKFISPMSSFTRDVNCYAGSFIYNANFWANITTVDGTGQDYINSLGAWDIYSLYGYNYFQSFSITKQQESSSGPAKARLSWQHVYNGTYNNWLQLNVGDDSWWATQSM